MHPLLLLIGGLSNLITLALIGTDVYLWRQWYRFKDSPYENEQDYASRCLLFAGLIVFLFLFGRLVFKFLLGRRGQDEPQTLRSSETTVLQRPEGHGLFVEFYGAKEAPPLVFVHGWNSNSNQWYYFKKHLASSYRLLMVDLPGMGKSGKPRNKDYSLAKFARDLEAVVELCGNRKPILLGHSIGGMTILTYCKLFYPQLPSRIAGIGLIHTTYTNPVRTSILSGLLTTLQKPVLTPLAHLMIATWPLLQLMNGLKYLRGSQHLNTHLIAYAGTETRGQLDLTAKLSTISPVDSLARGCLAMFDYEASDVLPQINVPTLVIGANKDKLTKPIASEYLAGHIPQAQLVMLQPSGHMGVLERNQEMIEAVQAFARNVFGPAAGGPAFPTDSVRPTGSTDFRSDWSGEEGKVASSR